MTVQILVDFNARHEHWHLPEQKFTITLQSNLGVMSKLAASQDLPLLHAEISARGLLWMRAELWGLIQGVRTLIAFTNAIYFE